MLALSLEGFRPRHHRPCLAVPSEYACPSPFGNIPTFEPSNLQTTNLDAASSISPLSATLTEKIRGWGPSIRLPTPGFPTPTRVTLLARCWAQLYWTRTGWGGRDRLRRCCWN